MGKQRYTVGKMGNTSLSQEERDYITGLKQHERDKKLVPTLMRGGKRVLPIASKLGQKVGASIWSGLKAGGKAYVEHVRKNVEESRRTGGGGKGSAKRR